VRWIAASSHSADVVNFMSLVYRTVVHFKHNAVHVVSFVRWVTKASPCLLEISGGAVWSVTDWYETPRLQFDEVNWPVPSQALNGSLPMYLQPCIRLRVGI
jgi:hypothetical protein